MTHPEELLADYVRDALSPRERAAVESHLATCERCVQEVAAARSARAALQALPVAAAPDGLAEHLRGSAAAKAARGDMTRWRRWVGPAAAVAAAALVLTLVLPKIGGGGGSGVDRVAGPATTAADAARPTDAVLLELQSTDYAEEGLSTLASASAKQLEAASDGESSFVSAPGVPTRTGSSEQSQNAADCIQKAFQQVSGSAVRLIRARFQGTPAYIGLYAEGPGGGQSADALTVRVASTQGCSPLSIAQIPL